MYEKDKRQRVTVRLSDEQFEFIKTQTDMLGISPSDYLRMLVNAGLYASRLPQDGENAKVLESMAQGLVKETLGRENDKAASDNQL